MIKLKKEGKELVGVLTVSAGALIVVVVSSTYLWNNLTAVNNLLAYVSSVLNSPNLTLANRLSETPGLTTVWWITIAIIATIFVTDGIINAERIMKRLHVPLAGETQFTPYKICVPSKSGKTVGLMWVDSKEMEDKIFSDEVEKK